jgi:hypothetical protein
MRYKFSFFCLFAHLPCARQNNWTSRRRTSQIPWQKRRCPLWATLATSDLASQFLSGVRPISVRCAQTHTTLLCWECNVNRLKVSLKDVANKIKFQKILTFAKKQPILTDSSVPSIIRFSPQSKSQLLDNTLNLLTLVGNVQCRFFCQSTAILDFSHFQIAAEYEKTP